MEMLKKFVMAVYITCVPSCKSNHKLNIRRGTNLDPLYNCRSKRECEERFLSKMLLSNQGKPIESFR